VPIESKFSLVENLIIFPESRSRMGIGISSYLAFLLRFIFLFFSHRWEILFLLTTVLTHTHSLSGSALAASLRIDFSFLPQKIHGSTLPLQYTSTCAVAVLHLCIASLHLPASSLCLLDTRLSCVFFFSSDAVVLVFGYPLNSFFLSLSPFRFVLASVATFPPLKSPEKNFCCCARRFF
jgi:hypothetical protein